jgi:Meiotically up-regulated gene 113
MKTIRTINFQEYFDKHCHELNHADLLELNKQDNNGALNNVISLLAENCFGVLIYEDKKIPEYAVYFANNSIKLRGIFLEISTELDSRIRIQLLFEFCKLINSEFHNVDIFDAFNIYQIRLRTGFEKLGYFTIGNEVKELEGKNVIGIVAVKKGIIRLPILDKLEIYRSFFSSNKNSQKIYESNQNKIYLLFDGKNNLIKIGHSKILKIREKTLQGQSPNWNLVTAWIAPQKIESELHRKFSAKRVRGEWFDLTFFDLKEINEHMNSFVQILIT